MWYVLRLEYFVFLHSKLTIFSSFLHILGSIHGVHKEEFAYKTWMPGAIITGRVQSSG